MLGVFVKQEALNGIIPMRPLSAHRVLWNNPTAKRMIEFLSVLVIGNRVGEGSTKLSPDFPAGIVRFLLVDALPGALSLNRFEITVVDPWVKLVALGIGDVRKGSDIQVQTAPI